LASPKARHEFDAQMSRSLVRIVVHELTRIRVQSVKIGIETWTIEKLIEEATHSE
jgi:hypothetical protein